MSTAATTAAATTATAAVPTDTPKQPDAVLKVQPHAFNLFSKYVRAATDDDMDVATNANAPIPKHVANCMRFSDEVATKSAGSKKKDEAKDDDAHDEDDADADADADNADADADPDAPKKPARVAKTLASLSIDVKYFLCGFVIKSIYDDVNALSVDQAALVMSRRNTNPDDVDNAAKYDELSKQVGAVNDCSVILYLAEEVVKKQSFGKRLLTASDNNKQVAVCFTSALAKFKSVPKFDELISDMYYQTMRYIASKIVRYAWFDGASVSHAKFFAILNSSTNFSFDDFNGGDAYINTYKKKPAPRQAPAEGEKMSKAERDAERAAKKAADSEAKLAETMKKVEEAKAVAKAKAEAAKAEVAKAEASKATASAAKAAAPATAATAPAPVAPAVTTKPAGRGKK